MTTMNKVMDHFLDVTNDVCPMTFVKTKIMIEKMSQGQTGEVRLRKGEPLENVPRSIRELGHEILGIEAETKESADTEPDIYRVRFRKS